MATALLRLSTECTLLQPPQSVQRVLDISDARCMRWLHWLQAKPHQAERSNVGGCRSQRAAAAAAFAAAAARADSPAAVAATVLARRLPGRLIASSSAADSLAAVGRRLRELVRAPPRSDACHAASHDSEQNFCQQGFQVCQG
jgi:hypothetical protein